MPTDPSLWPKQNLRPTKARHLQSGPMAVVGFFVNLFADFERRRPPPLTPGKTRHARLMTIRGSHYCEKGRWVMDLVEADTNSNIYYTEDPHPPGFHTFATVKASRDNGSITPSIVLDPIEEGGEVEYIAESTTILRRFLPILYPTEIKDQVMKMEDLIGAKLGPSVRVFMYNALLEPKHHPLIIKLMSKDATLVEQILFDKMFAVGIAPVIRKSMKVNSENAELSKTAIREVFDMVTERLQNNGGKYLMDVPNVPSYGFTAADLTFSSLASDLVFPPERADFQALANDRPEVITAFTDSLHPTLAAKHVLRMYQIHRPTNNETKLSSIKAVDRNKNPLRFW